MYNRLRLESTDVIIPADVQTFVAVGKWWYRVVSILPGLFEFVVDPWCQSLLGSVDSRSRTVGEWLPWICKVEADVDFSCRLLGMKVKRSIMVCILYTEWNCRAESEF